MRNPLLRGRRRPSARAPARGYGEARVIPDGIRSGSPGLQADEPGNKVVFRATTSAGLVLEWVSLVVPSLSVVTGLLFWFGWTFTNTRTAYFGLDSTTLQFSTNDYLIRSVDAIFVPAAVLLLGLVAVLLLHEFVVALLRRSKGSMTALRRGAVVMAAGGLVSTAFGVWAMFAPIPFDGYLMPPLLQGAGAAVAAYSFSLLHKLHRRTSGNTGQQRERARAWLLYCYALVAMLVLVNLFWATSLYAAALGTGKAQELEQRLSSRPSVTLYSKQALALGSPVAEEGIDIPGAMYQFKYTGLKLLIRSGGKYFLLSEGWSRQSGIAVVVEDNPDIRLELEPGKERR